MLKKALLLCTMMLISGNVLAANSDYVNACADMQQQTNSKITRSQAIKVCQCVESRQEKDLEKIQTMNNPTQAQIKKVMEDTARYCIKKAGIANNSGKTNSASNEDESSQSGNSTTTKPGGKIGGITIRGIR